MEKTSFSDLLNQLNELETKIIDQSGELMPDQELELQKLSDLSIPAKVDSLDFVLARISSAADFWDAKAKENRAISQSLYKAYDGLKAYVKGAMMASGKDEIFGLEKRLKLQKTAGKLVMSDEKSIPDRFKHIEMVTDKDLVKEAIKSGEVVPGASIEEGFSVRFYNNKGDKK